MLTRLETARLQEFGNDGLPLVNGKLYFYALQTTTPKETYQDIFGNALNTNPVELDSVGSASIYLNGSYTVSAVDQYGVVVGPTVDIAGGLNDFTTSAGGNFANNIILSVNTYSDIRALGVAYAWVFCQGRETQGDGGQGLFYYSVDNSVDDDGVTLSPNVNGSYVRYNIQNINPRWFGLVYGGIVSQESFLTLAGKASERYGIPVKVDGEVFINSNYSTYLWASEWIFSSNASLVSTLGITFTFTSDNRLLECGAEVFKNNVQPIFEEFVTDKILYSWMGGSNTEGKVAKFLAASEKTYTVEFDKRIILQDSLTLPENYYLFIGSTSTSGNIYFDTNSSVDLVIPHILPGSNLDNVVKYKQESTIGTIDLNIYIDPSFFCSNILNESVGILASIRSGKIELSQDYNTSATFITNDNVVIRAKKNQSFNIANLTLNSLDLDGVNFSGILEFNAGSIKNSTCTFTLANLGNYTIKDSTILGGIEILGQGNLENVVSTCVFSNVHDCINCVFSDYISPTSTFSGRLINTNFNEVYCRFNGVIANGLNISTTKKTPQFVIVGSNIIESSNFFSTIFKELCEGTSGEVTFNNCFFSQGITVSNGSGVVYKLNSCIGGQKESHAIIDGISCSSLELVSGEIITNTSASFVCVSAGTSAKFNNITSDGTSITFTKSGSYDYVTSSVGACVKIGTSANNLLEKFNAFGGSIEVTTENIGNSNFKVCVVESDFTFYTSLNMVPGYKKLTNPGTLVGTSRKIIAETPYIVNDSVVLYNFQTGLRPTNFKVNPTNGTFFLSDNLGIRTESYTTSANIFWNSDIVFVGFIDAGCKISIKITPNVPKNNDVYTKFYNIISANANSYETIYDTEQSTGQNYVSSGVNNVSNLWITGQSYKTIADKVSIEGYIPTVFNESRGDNFVYMFRNGYNIGLDSGAFLSGTFSPTTSAIIQNNVQITLSPIVSGNLTAKAPDYIKPLSATSFLKY